MNIKRILVKTFLNLIIGMMLLIIIIHVSIFFIYKNFYVSNYVERIATDMDYVVEILENTDDYDSVLKAYVKNNNINIGLKTSNETIFYRGNSLYLDYFSNKDSLLEVSGIKGTESVLFRTREITLKNGDNAIVQLSMNLQALKESKEIAVSLLPYSLILSFTFSLIFSYFYSKKITNPILEIRDSVREMTEINTNANISIKNTDELGALAEDINTLYANFLKTIDDYKIKTEEVMHIERERLDFFRGASHELKTPLARLSVIIENMKYNIGKYKDHNKYLSESLVIIDDLSQMISEILDGVKNLKVDEKNIKPIKVQEQLEKTINNYQLIAKSKYKDLQVDITGDFMLNIPESDLQKVLSNIISNAIKYGVKNKKIIIKLNNKELEVYNESLPIPDEIMKSIWDGEYVLEKNVDNRSNGLGLYIVKTILDSYNIKYYFIPFKNGYLFKIEK